MSVALPAADTLRRLIDQCWLESRPEHESLRERAALLLATTDPDFQRYLSALVDEAFSGAEGGQQRPELPDFLTALALSEYRLDDALDYPPEMRPRLMSQIASEARMTTEGLVRIDHWWRIESSQRNRHP